MSQKLTTYSPRRRGPISRGTNNPRDPRSTHEWSSSRPNGRARSSTPHRLISQVIEVTSAIDVYAALKHSIHLGRAPNRHMTINWEAAGVSDPIVATGKLMKLMRDGARRHNLDHTYIWVRECGRIVGEHVHIMFYLPSHLTEWFKSRKAGWLKLCGAKRTKGASKTVIIRGSTGTLGISPTSNNLFAVNLQRVADYILKHCSLEVQEVLGISGKGRCELAGKRVSISQNLHRKSRSQCADCASIDNNSATKIASLR